MVGSHHFSFLYRAACNTDEQAQNHGVFTGVLYLLTLEGVNPGQRQNSILVK